MRCTKIFVKSQNLSTQLQIVEFFGNFFRFIGEKMIGNKIFVILMMFVIVSFCGCLDIFQSDQNQIEDEPENKEKPEIEEFELLHYTVYSIGIDGWSWIDLGEGFVHNGEEVRAYQIKGRVKNNCGEKTKIVITMRFYDDNGIHLDTHTVYSKELPHTYEDDFDTGYIDHTYLSEICLQNAVEVKFFLSGYPW